MQKKNVSVVNTSENPLPEYGTEKSAGIDIRSDESWVLHPGERALIKTGLKVAIPDGYELQIRPRSGMALKHGVTVLNSPGTIDADYRGEVGVILINHSKDNFIINRGDRICQAVLNKVEQIEWMEVKSLDTTERGEGGFGHTGAN